MADQWLKQYRSKIKDARQIPLEDAPVSSRSRRKPRRYKILYRYLEKPSWWNENTLLMDEYYQGDEDWRVWREYPYRYYVREKDAERAFDAVRRWANRWRSTGVVAVECKVVER